MISLSLACSEKYISQKYDFRISTVAGIYHSCRHPLRNPLLVSAVHLPSLQPMFLAPYSNSLESFWDRIDPGQGILSPHSARLSSFGQEDLVSFSTVKYHVGLVPTVFLKSYNLLYKNKERTISIYYSK